MKLFWCKWLRTKNRSWLNSKAAIVNGIRPRNVKEERFPSGIESENTVLSDATSCSRDDEEDSNVSEQVCCFTHTLAHGKELISDVLSTLLL